MSSWIFFPILVILLLAPTLIVGRSISESTTHGYGSNLAKKELIKDEYSTERTDATTIAPILSIPHEDSDENEDNEEEDFCVIEMDSENGKDDADISSEDEDCFVLDEESHEIYETGSEGSDNQEEDSKTTNKLATFVPRKVNTNDVVEAENNKLIADRLKSKLVTVKPPTDKWILDQKY